MVGEYLEYNTGSVTFDLTLCLCLSVCLALCLCLPVSVLQLDRTLRRALSVLVTCCRLIAWLLQYLLKRAVGVSLKIGKLGVLGFSKLQLSIRSGLTIVSTRCPSALTIVPAVLKASSS